MEAGKMGRIYQVDYDQAFALCAEMERVMGEMEGQAAALGQSIEPVESHWVPHGTAVQAYGTALIQHIRKHVQENRAAIAALRQALNNLRALEEEQARRMRSPRPY
jgi:uncharacterized membrane protein YccC